MAKGPDVGDALVCRSDVVGLSAVRLLRVDDGVLRVEGIDHLGTTPILDFKAWGTEFDAWAAERGGRLQGRAGRAAEARVHGRSREEEPALRAVLFDFGGVLAEEGFHAGLRALAERWGADPDALLAEGFRAVHDSGYVTGHGTEAEFWGLLRERTPVRGTDRELREEVLRRFQIRPRVLEAALTLRSRGFRVAILSDQTDWLDVLDARHGLSRVFERVFSSYHRGKTKRDPTAFDDAVRALGVEPPEALFLDDDPANVERARSRGLRALHFPDPEEGLARLAAATGVAPPGGDG